MTFQVKFFLPLIVFLILTSCVVSPMNMNHNKVDPQLAQIIFIPGFYGTKLAREDSGKKIWLTFSQALFGSQTLAMTGFEIPEAIPLVPAGVLDKVKIFCGLFSVNIYGGIIELLQEKLSGKAQVHILAYDWRKDYFKAVQLLDQKVSELKSNGAGSISIVSHSMGGLVTSYYLRYGGQEPETAKEDWSGAKQIKKVVMAGVPFRGSIISFRNMKWGIQWGANTNLTKGDAFSSFETNYQLLPQENHKILDENLKQTELDILDARNWQNYEWGFLKNTTSVSEEGMKKRVDFVKKSVERSKLLGNHLLNKSLSIENASLKTKLLYIYSVSVATQEKAVLLEKEKRILFDLKEFEEQFPDEDYPILFADGDGTVTKTSSQLPEAYQKAFSVVNTLEIKAEHTKIYSDPMVQNKLLKFLEFSENE